MSEEHPFKHVMIDYSVTMNDVLVERSRRVWNEESVRLIYSLESTLSLAQGHKVLGSWEIEIFATWGTFEHPRRRFIGRHKVPTVLDLEPGTALSAVISRVSMEHEWVKAEVERKAHEEALQVICRGGDTHNPHQLNATELNRRKCYCGAAVEIEGASHE